MYKFIIVLFTMIFLTGCNRNSGVTPEEFLIASNKVGAIETMRHTIFLGVKDGDAYIQIWNGLAMRKADQYRTITVSFKKLPVDVQHKISNSIMPWVVNKI